MAKRNRDSGREAFWRGVLKRQAQGGHSVRAFCRREKLSEPSFYAWRRTIAERDGNRTRSVKSGAVKALAFVPLTVTSESRRASGFVIELAGGRVLRLPESIPAERLAELVQALEVGAEP